MGNRYDGKLCIERGKGRTVIGEVIGDNISVKEVFGPNRELKSVPISDGVVVYDATVREVAGYDDIVMLSVDCLGKALTDIIGKGINVLETVLVKGGTNVTATKGLGSTGSQVLSPAVAVVSDNWVITLAKFFGEYWYSVSDRKDGRPNNFVYSNSEEGYIEVGNGCIKSVVEAELGFSVDRLVYHKLGFVEQIDLLFDRWSDLTDFWKLDVSLLRFVNTQTKARGRVLTEELLKTSRFLVEYVWHGMPTASICKNLIGIVKDLPVIG